MKAALVSLLLVLAATRAAGAEDVPFITTPDNVTLAMLKLAGVGPGDHVLDLGSGDGRIVITAARRFGARGTGVEIVPDLVATSRRNAEAAGVATRVRFLEQDLFQTDLAQASVITMYLLPEVNLQLRPKLLALAPGTRIVSHDWDLGDWAPDRTLTVAAPDKAIGREKLSRLHRWVVPARIEGLWCAPGGSLRLQQRFQFVDGRIELRGTSWAVNGRLDGTSLHLQREGGASLVARASGDRLRLVAARQGIPARWKPAAGETCPA